MNCRWVLCAEYNADLCWQGLWDLPAPGPFTDDPNPCLLGSCTQPGQAWQALSALLLITLLNCTSCPQHCYWPPGKDEPARQGTLNKAVPHHSPAQYRSETAKHQGGTSLLSKEL